MNLLIDVGNTRIKWAVWSEERLGATVSATHAGSLDSALDRLVSGLPAGLSRIVIANVAGPELAARLGQTLARATAIEPEFVETRLEQLGVRCGYVDPARLGVDRWVAMIAAFRLARVGAAGTPVCVVDAGTSLTFDVLDPAGLHCGGLILAGPALSAGALALGTSAIGPTSAHWERRRGLGLFGTTTEEAVGRGAWLAVSAAVDRAAGIVTEAFGRAPALYLTGGDALALASWLQTELRYNADLVLEGLAMICNAAEVV